MKIAVACDHGGLRLKNVLIDEMKKQGYEVVDYGTYTEDSCDYPDYASQASVYQLHVIRQMVSAAHYVMMYLVQKRQELIMILT